MGEGKGERSRAEAAEAEEHDLSGGAQADRGGTKGKMGEGQAGSVGITFGHATGFA